jgi:hypothetical protein
LQGVGLEFGGRKEREGRFWWDEEGRFFGREKEIFGRRETDS